MTITIEAPAGDLVLSGDGRGGPVAQPAPPPGPVDETHLEVWVTQAGTGARVCRVPTAAITGVEWTETLGPLPSCSAQLTIDRMTRLDPNDPGSWLMWQLRRVEREIQIIYRGVVVHWGPVVSLTRTPGGADVTVGVAGPEWWLGVRLITGDAVNFGSEQIRGQRVFDPPWSGFTWSQGVWYRRSEWRFSAQVWVDGSTGDGVPIMQIDMGHSGVQPVIVRAGRVPRGGWVTVVAYFSPRGSGQMSKSQALEFQVMNCSVREVSAQLSPTSIGLEVASEEPEVIVQERRRSWEEIVGHAADFGLVAWAETPGPEMPVTWRRPDTVASEAARQVASGAEAAISLNPWFRVAKLWDQRGVTRGWFLTDDEVVSWGSWSSGLDRPTTEWIVADAKGFTSVLRDTSRFGGLLLQSYVSAPHGHGTEDLTLYGTELQREAGLSEQITAVLPWERWGQLEVGDIIQAVVDADGPDMFAGRLRCTGLRVDPAADGFEAALAKWDGPW